MLPTAHAEHYGILSRTYLTNCYKCSVAVSLILLSFRRYVERWGCCRWTDDALDRVRSFSPLIEVGAGHGHWQLALSQRGADVLAIDDRSALPVPGLADVGEVHEGNEKELRK